MMFSSLLLTVMCCVLLVESGQKGPIDLSSPYTTAAQVEAAYKISNSAATSQYNNGQAGPPGLPGPSGPSGPSGPPGPSGPGCYRGPVTREYSRPGYFYWPPIYIKQCDGLPCKHPRKCAASRTRSFNRWATVYRVSNSKCYFAECEYLRLVEHVSCYCQSDGSIGPSGQTGTPGPR